MCTHDQFVSWQICLTYFTENHNTEMLSLRILSPTERTVLNIVEYSIHQQGWTADIYINSNSNIVGMSPVYRRKSVMNTSMVDISHTASVSTFVVLPNTFINYHHHLSGYISSVKVTSARFTFGALDYYFYSAWMLSWQVRNCPNKSTSAYY